jgi:hypothetical protein
MSLRLKKRKKGWALDPGDETTGVGFRERLIGSDKLWLVLFVAIVVVAGFVIARSSKPTPIGNSHPYLEIAGSAKDDAHVKYLDEFVRMADRRRVPVKASFISSRNLKLVMSADVDTDEMHFLSRAAAIGLQHRLHMNAVVWTYCEDAKTGVPKLVAQTTWDPETADFKIETK